MGARGNSGIILSQVVRGAALELARDGRFDGAAVARALAAASDAAYAAVTVPVEGTMLTVIREMARGADAARDGGAERALEAALAEGERALARTPELLPRLREAGVVDAGGRRARGAPPRAARRRPRRAGAAAASRSELGHAVALDAMHAEPSAYRYCTSFLVEGEAVDRDELTAALAAFGDSVLVVGAPPAFKAHVHTDDPGGALRVGTAAGVIGGVEVSDMYAQTAERLGRLAPERACDVVFVTRGAGNRALAESLGARAIVDRGPDGEDPSTEQILAAIDGARAEGVLVLPNDASAVLAAESAAAHATRPARACFPVAPSPRESARSSRTCPTPTSTRTAPRWPARSRACAAAR